MKLPMRLARSHLALLTPLLLMLHPRCIRERAVRMASMAMTPQLGSSSLPLWQSFHAKIRLLRSLPMAQAKLAPWHAEIGLTEYVKFDTVNVVGSPGRPISPSDMRCDRPRSRAQSMYGNSIWAGEGALDVLIRRSLL